MIKVKASNKDCYALVDLLLNIKGYREVKFIKLNFNYREDPEDNEDFSNLENILTPDEILEANTTQYIKFPVTHVLSVKYTASTSLEYGNNYLTAEIESTNDTSLLKMLQVLKGLADPGHCFGAFVQLNDTDAWVDQLCLDGDGCDEIVSVELMP